MPLFIIFKGRRLLLTYETMAGYET